MATKKLISRKQYEGFVAKLPKDYCPFCHIEEQIVLGTSANWTWVACMSPYWRYHTLIVPKKHKLDITDIADKEFSELKKFYKKIVNHLLKLGLKHTDKKPIDQFLLMIRVREENILGGSTYYKPNHLHIHLVPDREGVERLILDKSAINVDIKKIALPTNFKNK